MKLGHNELIILLSSIGGVLILARIFAELGKKIKMPIVMGEIMLGIIIGPTIMGAVSPDFFNYIFSGNPPFNNRGACKKRKRKFCFWVVKTCNVANGVDHAFKF